MSEKITRRIHAPLQDKKILLGLTASSAIYKSIDLARTLIRMGAKVKIVMTKNSLELIGEKLVEWSIGEKPYIEVTGEVEHIKLAEWADALVIAPATLKSMSKIANGVLDELLYLVTTTMLGMGKKVIVLPTMNIYLYNSPQYRIIRGKLVEQGVEIIEPYIEEDKAKYPPINDLAHCIDALINRGRDLDKLKILVTTGATYEYLDPVRVITNPSSGLMGILVAREAYCRGAIVDLVYGVSKHDPPYNVNVYRVETTSEMYHTVRKLSMEKNYHIAVFAAAPADYKPINRSNTKISTMTNRLINIRLQETPKTIKAIPRRNRPLVKIIFAAETVNDYTELIRKAREKLEYYDADIVVAHIVSRHAGFTVEYLDACIIDREKHQCFGLIPKEKIARIILDYANEKIKKRSVDQ